MSYCTQCGNQLTENAQAFCSSCGSSVKDDLVPSQAPLSQVGQSKRKKAKQWVNGYSVTGAGVAAVAIIPGATTAALFTLETTMVLHIGRIYRGQQFSKEDAVAVVGAAGFMGTVGLGAKVAMEGLNFFPVIGWAIKGGIAGSIIKTLGELIIKYFESIEHQA